MAPLPEKDKRLWNRIYLDKIPNAINPHICIRCLQRKDEPGVNTVCAACRLYLDAPKNAAEDFLFSTCLRIFDFWLWLRRQTLSDEFVLRNREHGAAVEHYIGMPGDKQELPSLSGDTKLAGDDGGHGCELQSPMARELLKQVMLTSRQCDRVMVLLADIMEQELLQGTPVSKVDEILFNANHEYTSTHWCYRATLADGRQFAITFSDRQLGWLHIVRDWKEYVLDRFHKVDEVEALFYMANPKEPDTDAMTEDEKAVKSCWKSRGVRVCRLGGVQAAHVRLWYPQRHWPRAAVQIWTDELPPYDMFSETMSEDWVPKRGLTGDQIERRQRRFGCHLVKDDGGVGTLWKRWEGMKGMEGMKGKRQRESESKLDRTGGRDAVVHLDGDGVGDTGRGES